MPVVAGGSPRVTTRSITVRRSAEGQPSTGPAPMDSTGLAESTMAVAGRWDRVEDLELLEAIQDLEAIMSSPIVAEMSTNGIKAIINGSSGAITTPGGQ